MRWIRRMLRGGGPDGDARDAMGARAAREDRPAREDRQSKPLEPPPSRPPQINIRGDAEVIARFRALCRAERRTYADMLAVLLDAYDAREGRE